MNKTYIFPIILIVIMCFASIVYAASGNYKQAVYWAAVAFANIAVTF